MIFRITKYNILHLLILTSLFFVFPLLASAQIIFSEVMYAPEEGAAHEWFEIFNNGGDEVDITDWRFSDGGNHIFVEPPKNGGQGSLVILPGVYAIVAKEADTFLSTHPGFSGTVIDGSFSLTDIGDTLTIIDGEGVTVDTVSYGEDAGARKNGFSLQLIDGVWSPTIPTPGSGSLFQEEEPQTQQENGSTSSYASDNFPVEPQIFAQIITSAGDDGAVTVGADSLFKGRAVGLSKEALSGARYVWSFGDGGRKEGESVLYHYRYPGKYVVVLDVSSGEHSATDRVLVSALPVNMILTEATTEKITLSNKSDREINLSWWKFKVGSNLFSIPENTIMLPGQPLTFSSELTKLSPKVISDVLLLYPNGAAVSFEEPSVAMTKGVLEKQVSIQTQAGTSLGFTPGQSIVGRKLPTVDGSEESREKVVENTNEDVGLPQVANISESVSGKENSSSGYWFALVGMILLGVVSVILLRRKSREEITIIE